MDTTPENGVAKSAEPYWGRNPTVFRDGVWVTHNGKMLPEAAVKRREIALAFLRKYEGKVANKHVLKYVEKVTGKPISGYLVNMLRKHLGYPIPTRGGYLQGESLRYKEIPELEDKDSAIVVANRKVLRIIPSESVVAIDNASHVALKLLQEANVDNTLREVRFVFAEDGSARAYIRELNERTLISD